MDLWADRRDHATRLARVDPRLVDAVLAVLLTGLGCYLFDSDPVTARRAMAGIAEADGRGIITAQHPA